MKKLERQTEKIKKRLDELHMGTQFALDTQSELIKQLALQLATIIVVLEKDSKDTDEFDKKFEEAAKIAEEEYQNVCKLNEDTSDADA